MSSCVHMLVFHKFLQIHINMYKFLGGKGQQVLKMVILSLLLIGQPSFKSSDFTVMTASGFFNPKCPILLKHPSCFIFKFLLFHLIFYIGLLYTALYLLGLAV